VVVAEVATRGARGCGGELSHFRVVYVIYEERDMAVGRHFWGKPADERVGRGSGAL
jgi:hypothetical protein